MSKHHLKKRGGNRRRAALAKKVLMRDKGICFRCGKDCEKLLEQILNSSEDKRMRLAVSHRISASRLRQVVEESRINRRLWDIDHIQLVSEQGTYEIDNLRTVCTACHLEINKCLKK